MSEKLYRCAICCEHKPGSCFSEIKGQCPGRDSKHSYCKPCRSQRVYEAKRNKIAAERGTPIRPYTPKRSSIWPREAAELRCDTAFMSWKSAGSSQFGAALV